PEHGPGRVGCVTGPDPFRDLFRWPFAETRYVHRGGTRTASAGGYPRHRATSVLRTQRYRRSLAPGRSEPSRVGRSVRRTRPVVLPHRRLSQLRERIDLWVRHLPACSARSTVGGKCPDLL